MLETNIINGKSFITKLGTNKVVRTNGFKIPTFIFLKNSISSNRFKITPKQKIIKTTVKKFQSIDILVNCAGIQFVVPIEKYPEKIWRQMLDINLTTPFLIINYHNFIV